MRLIDADRLALEIGLARGIFLRNGFGKEADTLGMFKEFVEGWALDNKFVGCSKCKHYDSHDHRCKFFNHGIKENDWCSYGEVKHETY